MFNFLAISVDRNNLENREKWLKKIFKKILPWNILRSYRLYKWRKDKGDKKLRVDYPLNENSAVFDVGGYQGNWSKDIIEEHDPFIYIFEPVSEYYYNLVDKFSDNEKIKVFNFGLSDRNKKSEISVLAESSSTYKKTDGLTVMAEFRDIYDFIHEEDLDMIDLIKINIEGGEYELLPRLIETGDVKRCKNLQIQFHSFVSKANQRMKEIQKNLSKTHILTYQYKFVWENWKLKDDLI